MSFSNLIVNKKQVVDNLSRYVIGAGINQEGESSGIVPGMALMGGISGGTWLLQNRKDLKGGVETIKRNAGTQRTIVNSATKYNSNSVFGEIGNKLAGATEYTSREELASILNKLDKQKWNSLPNADAVKETIKRYGNSPMNINGQGYKQTLKEVEKLIAENTQLNHTLKVEAERVSGSTVRLVKDQLKLTELSSATKQLAAKSGGFRTLMKGVKGNAAFAAIAFGLGVVTDVVPAFQIGKKEGFKQLGKTAVKTGFEVAGWAAGTAIGGEIGAAVGSFCGPLGTIVGGAIGMACGFVGSFIASKIADKVVGPNEVELAEAKQQEQIAEAANTDIEQFGELVQLSYWKLAEHAAMGQITVNDIEVKKDLEKIIGTKINLKEAAKLYVELVQAQEQEEESAQPQVTYEYNSSNPFSAYNSGFAA